MKLLLTFLLLAAVADAAEKPNIILFLVDDMGWMDSGAYGSQYYETPNIDRFAQRALRFTNAYACPLCSPTRASLLTGQYSARHGITSATGHLPPQEPGHRLLPGRTAPNRPIVMPESKNFLEPSQYTLAESLHDAGYRTGHFGKWHLGLTEPYWPDKQGFDVVFHAKPDPGPPSYFSPYGFRKYQSFPDGPAGEYITDRLTQEAIKFIGESKGQPFFLNLWHYGVHGPWGHKEEYTKTFAAKKDARGAQGNPIMASMLKSIDESFGRIIETLDRLNLSSNTIVIFNSDNGGNTHSNTPDDRKTVGKLAGPRSAQIADWRKWAGDLPPTNNAPLRDGKGTIYEGGVRVPLMWAGPQIVHTGETSPEVVSAIDLYPTLLDLAGIPKRSEQLMDGISYAAVLRGTGKLARQAYFTFFPHGGPSKPAAVAVRSGDWKLIRLFETGPDFPTDRELYNLSADLGETRNLAGTMPKKVKELDSLIDGFLATTGALVPKANPAYKAPVLSADDGRGPISGWKLRQCTAVPTQDGVRIEPNGPRPFLGTAQYRHNGPCELQIRTKPAAGGPGEVHWRLASQKEFSPQQVVRFEFPKGDEWREFTVPIPTQEEAVQFRVYLPPGHGLELSRIALKAIPAN